MAADQTSARPGPPAGRPGQRDLTSGPISRTLLAFALPTLGSSILQSLNGSINAVWVGRQFGDAQQYLRVHIANIRRKIEQNPLNPQYIITEPGVGYRFASPDGLGS